MTIADGDRIIDLDKTLDLVGSAAECSKDGDTHSDLALSTRAQALASIDMAQSLRIVCDRLTSIEMSLDRIAQPMTEDASGVCSYRVTPTDLGSPRS